jgi:hypothetical protein
MRLALGVAIAPLVGVVGLSVAAAPASAAAARTVSAPSVVVSGADPTTLEVVPVSIVGTVTSLLHATYAARLVDATTGAPLAGQFVLFSDSALVSSANPLGNLICEPVTNADGWATCTVQGSDLLNALTAQPAFTATFFGTPQYQSSRAYGCVALL